MLKTLPIASFPRWIFWMAGAYGLAAIVPLYFLEESIGRHQPPPITHPEFFYGFAGVTLGWQVAFVVIGSDPRRYRWMMLPAVIEKWSFAVAAAVLAAQERIGTDFLAGGMIDLVLGALFLVAFFASAHGPESR